MAAARVFYDRIPDAGSWSIIAGSAFATPDAPRRSPRARRGRALPTIAAAGASSASPDASAMARASPARAGAPIMLCNTGPRGARPRPPHATTTAASLATASISSAQRIGGRGAQARRGCDDAYAAAAAVKRRLAADDRDRDHDAISWWGGGAAAAAGGGVSAAAARNGAPATNGGGAAMSKPGTVAPPAGTPPPRARRGARGPARAGRPATLRVDDSNLDDRCTPPSTRRRWNRADERSRGSAAGPAATRDAVELGPDRRPPT